MIGLCQICGRNPATIYDDDLELRVCGDCRASYVHGDEMAMEDQPERNGHEIPLMAATFAFACCIVLFVAEPSTTAGALVICSMLGYAAVAAWVALTDHARRTKRYGVTCKISEVKFTFGSPKKDYGSTTFESNSRAPVHQPFY